MASTRHRPVSQHSLGNDGDDDDMRGNAQSRVMWPRTIASSSEMQQLGRRGTDVNTQRGSGVSNGDVDNSARGLADAAKEQTRDADGAGSDRARARPSRRARSNARELERGAFCPADVWCCGFSEMCGPMVYAREGVTPALETALFLLSQKRTREKGRPPRKKKSASRPKYRSTHFTRPCPPRRRCRCRPRCRRRCITC